MDSIQDTEHRIMYSKDYSTQHVVSFYLVVKYK